MTVMLAMKAIKALTAMLPRLVPTVLLSLLAACSGPQTGSWSGSAEVRGESDALVALWGVQLHCSTDPNGDEQCRVDLQAPGKPLEQLPACSFVRERRSAEVSVDPGRPGCDGPAASRVALIGTIGEGVWFGQVVRGGKAVGQFRAYWSE